MPAAGMVDAHCMICAYVTEIGRLMIAAKVSSELFDLEYVRYMT